MSKVKNDQLDHLSLQCLTMALSYDQSTGEFRWLTPPGQRTDLVGAVAGGIGLDGYRKIRLLSLLFQAHRLAWFYHYGERPNRFIDHINGDRADNRITNLRDVEHETNMQNVRAPRSRSTLGILGVSETKKGRFTASLGLNGKSIHLGTFGTSAEAHDAYLAAKRRLHSGCTI